VVPGNDSGVREKPLRTQPLPATAGIMASLGLYAHQFPLALVVTLFPMEEPELEFLELFQRRAQELELPPGFLAPIVAHSDVDDEEAHDAVSLDAEIMAWWPAGGLRDFTENPYRPEAGRRLTCALATSWA
jgi:hypothetical protein